MLLHSYGLFKISFKKIIRTNQNQSTKAYALVSISGITTKKSKDSAMTNLKKEWLVKTSTTYLSFENFAATTKMFITDSQPQQGKHPVMVPSSS